MRGKQPLSSESPYLPGNLCQITPFKVKIAMNDCLAWVSMTSPHEMTPQIH